MRAPLYGLSTRPQTEPAGRLEASIAAAMLALVYGTAQPPPAPSPQIPPDLAAQLRLLRDLERKRSARNG